jgi:hypothetical protein
MRKIFLNGYKKIIESFHLTSIEIEKELEVIMRTRNESSHLEKSVKLVRNITNKK